MIKVEVRARDEIKGVQGERVRPQMASGLL